MSTIVVADQVRIPSWVNDLESFRRWSRSDDYPERGWVSFLDSEIWVDTYMEQLFTHNRVKTRFTGTLAEIAEAEELGYYLSDRASLSNEDANLSTEEDGTFCSFDAIEKKRVRLLEGVEEGHVEIEGTPDMVLEVVSTRSVSTRRYFAACTGKPVSPNTGSSMVGKSRRNLTFCAGPSAD